jgi:alkylhydroperoxidase family enzyme
MSALPVRVPPLERLDELSEPQRQALTRLGRRSAHPKNIYRTLLRYPDFLQAMGPLGARLADAGHLPPRLRELAILRTAWRCDCEYEWAQHAEIAAGVGMTPAEIQGAAEGPESHGLSAGEQAIVRAVDELEADRRLSDATWTGLVSGLGEAAVVDLIATWGLYSLLAGVLRTLGVPIEAGRAGYPAELAARRGR